MSIVDLPLPEAVSLIEEGGRYTFQNSNGRSLYTYDRDKKDRSDCNDQCALTWEPVVAREGAAPMGDWTLVARKDGQMQWAYQGAPIYANHQENSDGTKPDLDRNSHWHILVPDTTVH